MTDVSKRTIEAFQQLAQKLREELPAFGELFNRYEAGDLSIDDALVAGSNLLMQNPELMKQFQPVKLTENEIMVAKGTGDGALQEIPRSADQTLSELGLTTDDLLYLDDEDKVRLNPLYLTAIAERAQFDGDVPELRFSGDMPEGATPAVPVETDAASPVALGSMLETAQDEVATELKELVEGRQAAADEALAELASTSLDGDQKTTALALDKAKQATLELHKPVNVEGYSRGHMPTKRKVEGPTGAELALMSPQRRQELAWKAISTTQGRRSAVPAVAQIVERNLLEAGFTVKYVTGWSNRVNLSRANWTTGIGDGPGSMNPSFAPIGMSGHALSTAMVKELRESNVGKDLELELEVGVINEVWRRQVGWKVQVVMPKLMPQIEEGSA